MYQSEVCKLPLILILLKLFLNLKLLRVLLKACSILNLNQKYLLQKHLRYSPHPLLTLYGPDPDPTIIDLSVIIPKPPKPNPNIGKILNNYESDSRRRLRAAMTTSRSSANPSESDFAWEDYKSWINSKISKLKNLRYKVSERNFCYGFVPLMEIWKLRNAPLCLPAPEIKEVIPKVEVDFGHP